jgi:hypothetical protein
LPFLPAMFGQSPVGWRSGPRLPSQSAAQSGPDFQQL